MPLAPRNRLDTSASLYLRQHADHPVHWQPWDDDAFALAQAGERPILLSIGYSACHWCHVMARESFADPAIAAVMNASFVCIKVDREERPDLDRFFLSAMARIGKAAGWPLTVFLAPDATPFGGGGYFPPEPRFGLPAFGTVLLEAAASYRDRGPAPGAACTTAATTSAYPVGPAAVSDALLDHVARNLAGGIDRLYGGFGADGPKFLHAAGHELLLRAWDRGGDPAMLETVAASVAQICNGAVFDHVGGGFHRYAVDDRWRVPHFEKMLNDNALMVRLATQLWQATGGTLFAARVEATIGWMLRDLRMPGGAFASSLAASSMADDSMGADTDGVVAEGAFYLWSKAQLLEALQGRLTAFHTAFAAVTEPPLAGRYALIRTGHDLDWTDDGATDADLAALRLVRARRVAPLRDDKCLADWNGLAIAALAEAGMAFNRADWIAAARSVFAAVLDSLATNPRGGPNLAHCAAGGVRSAAGLLDDYAAMAQAAMALHEATAEPAFLDHALAWEHVLDSQFWDQADGAYFLTAADAEQRIPRQKLIDETASPAGNGLMLGVLARLHALTGSERFRYRFEDILRCFADRLSRAHLQAATALCNSQALERMVQVVIVGDGDKAGMLRHAAARCFVPDRLITTVPDGASLARAPAAAGKPTLDGEPAAYVCIAQRCMPPTPTPATLTGQLSRASRRSP